MWINCYLSQVIPLISTSRIALAYRLKSQNYTVIDEAANHPDLTGSNVTSVTEESLAAHPDFVQTWYSVIELMPAPTSILSATIELV